MTPEVLHGLLWRVRSGLRADSLTLSAGHGIADPNYRPPRLPYASVLGPLDIETESERELPEAVYVRARSPGFLRGAVRQELQLIPDVGSLRLRFDADATVDVAISFGALAGQAFDDGTGPRVAATIETALHTAIDAGAVELESGTLDSDRQAELRAATVRWDRHQSRILVASGRRGTLDRLDARVYLVSRVEVLDADVDFVKALGLGVGAYRFDGRILRHKVANPSAVSLIVRLDLWAGTQRDLALIADAWCRVTPTRGQLLVRPGLLIEDIAHGATELRLQHRGESPHPATLLQLEAERRFVDRMSASAPSLHDDASLDKFGLHLNGNASARLLVCEAPALPSPWSEGNPAPYGFAAALGLALEADPSDGDRGQVLRLLHGERAVLQLQLEVSAVGNEGDLQVDLIARAERDDGKEFAESRARLPLGRLRTASGIQVHVLVSATDGWTRIFVDGVPGVAPQNFPSPEPVPGASSGGTDMQLLLGNPEGIDLQLRIAHVQLYAQPLGPSDPQLRGSLANAGAWRPGEPVVLARSTNGYSGEGETFSAMIVATDGDTLSLDRPVEGDWPLAKTLVYQRALFFAQTQFRRRDDFMNQLYRVALEYRVSAFLQQHETAISAPLVEDYDVNIRTLHRVLAEEANPEAPEYGSRPAAGGPGVRPVIFPARGNQS